MTYEGNVSKRPLNTADKIAVVFGGCGFIGHHLARRLQKEGYWVRVADIKSPEHTDLSTFADDFYHGDLANEQMAYDALNLGRTDVEVYQLAADMGGASYIFTGENDSNVMTNSAAINLNVVRAMIRLGLKRVFYSSSACIYPEHNQMDRIIQTAKNLRPIPQIQIVSTDGKNYSVKDFIWHTTETMDWNAVSHDSITFMVLKEHGKVVVKRHLPHYAVR